MITIDKNIKLQLTTTKPNNRAQSNPRAYTENLENTYQNKKMMEN